MWNAFVLSSPSEFVFQICNIRYSKPEINARVIFHKVDFAFLMNISDLHNKGHCSAKNRLIACF